MEKKIFKLLSNKGKNITKLPTSLRNFLYGEAFLEMIAVQPRFIRKNIWGYKVIQVNVWSKIIIIKRKDALGVPFLFLRFLPTPAPSQLQGNQTSWTAKDCQVSQMQIQIPVLLLTSCVTLGKLLSSLGLNAHVSKMGLLILSGTAIVRIRWDNG